MECRKTSDLVREENGEKKTSDQVIYLWLCRQENVIRLHLQRYIYLYL